MAEATGESPLVVVTGASGGIGMAVVDRFSQAGWDVEGTVRSEEKAAALMEAFPDQNVTASVLELTDLDSIEPWAKNLVSERGVPDALVSNAGTTQGDGLVMKRKPHDMLGIVTANFLGPFEVARNFAPKMSKKGGSIVTMSSVVAYAPNKGQAPYSATKIMADKAGEEIEWLAQYGEGVPVGDGVGEIGMDRAMTVAHEELGPRGLRVVSLAPGAVATDMFLSLPDEVQEYLLKKTDDKEAIEPSTVGSATLLLVEGNVSGKIVHMDNGITSYPDDPESEHVNLRHLVGREGFDPDALEIYLDEIAAKVH